MVSRYDARDRDAGEGTYTNTRRDNPPKGVQPVEVVQADGAVLGGDGNYHPMQEVEPGVLAAGDARLRDKTDEMILLLRAVVLGLEAQTGRDYFKEVGLRHP